MIIETVSPPVLTPRTIGPRARKFILSADLGQQADPTALAVLEVTTRANVVYDYYGTPEALRGVEPPREWFPKGRDGGPVQPTRVVRIDVRHLERLPLRMNYLDVMEHV